MLHSLLQWQIMLKIDVDPLNPYLKVFWLTIKSSSSVLKLIALVLKIKDETGMLYLYHILYLQTPSCLNRQENFEQTCSLRLIYGHKSAKLSSNFPFISFY